jgi:hypothetical protein
MMLNGRVGIPDQAKATGRAWKITVTRLLMLHHQYNRNHSSNLLLQHRDTLISLDQRIMGRIFLATVMICQLITIKSPLVALRSFRDTRQTNINCRELAHQKKTSPLLPNAVLASSEKLVEDCPEAHLESEATSGAGHSLEK